MSFLAYLCRNSFRRSSSDSFCRDISSLGFLLNSSVHGRDKPFKSSVTCALSGDHFLPSVAVRSQSICAKQSYRSIATQANCDEQHSMSETLKQVLLAAESDPVSTRETCGTIIDNLCRSKNLSDAAQLIKGLHDRRIYLSLNVYKVLLATAAEVCDFELTSLVFKDLLLTTKIQDQMLYIYVAKAFEKATDVDPLLRFIREISELTLPGSTTVINRIIFGFSLSCQAGKALLIFKEMRNLKCKPDGVTFNTVLDILGKAGQVDQMLSEFASMKEANCDPDIVTYYTLINNSRKMGRFNLLYIFIQEMVKRGIQPDLHTYAALIDGIGRSGNIDLSLKLFIEMRRKRLRPNFYIYRALISDLKKAGKFELARGLSEEMNSLGSQG